uniref:Rhodanese domain-containing protein n=1 Tax=Stegastes partitus TaxID=144197 RepID=A0A3B5ASM9_9TELE
AVHQVYGRFSRLASLIQRGTGRLLVIDSRTFSEYNASHVQGAVNVCCSKLVKRRLQQDKVSVTELLQPNGKVKVELGRKQEVVVYDQSSKEAGHLSKDGFVHILMGKLEGTFHKVSLLTGTHQCLCVPVCEILSACEMMNGVLTCKSLGLCARIIITLLCSEQVRCCHCTVWSADVTDELDKGSCWSHNASSSSFLNSTQVFSLCGVRFTGICKDRRERRKYKSILPECKASLMTL